MAKTLYKVAQRGFNSQNLLNINAYIQQKEINGSQVLSDVIYLEATKGIKNENGHGIKYDTENKITMKFNSYELRVLCFALRTLHSKKKCDYKKYSEPMLSGSPGNKKTLSLASSENENVGFQFYINIEEKENLKIGILFDYFELPAFVGSIEKIADEVDVTLYSYQRKLDKNMRLNKSE